MDATANTSTTAADDQSRSGGIKDFIAQTNMIGNVIAAAASQKNTFEPLPFPNMSLFDETYSSDVLKINVSPHAAKKHVFLPKTRITVKVTAERKHGAHIFHPYVYTLVFTHGDHHTWEVIRSYKEIKEAHKILAKMVKLDIGKSVSDLTEDDIKPDWPLFPTDHDHLVSATHIEERCRKLAEYLERMLTYPPYRDHPAVLALLGVSHLSFVEGLGQSVFEGPLQKRSGDNVYYGHLSQLKICCDKVKIFHDKRWFILKDTYLVYTIPENNESIGFAMLLDKKFECKMKIRAGAYHAIVIKNLQRSLVLKCKSNHQQREWYDKITYMMQSEVGRYFHQPQFLINDSFAPVRANQMTRWYVNAAQYMEHVLLGLNNAKEEIFITDWWLCPELFLKRPSDDLQYRLDKILLKKANEGVKVYVMLFKEVTLAITLLSSRAKNVLSQNGRNPNIKVLRHPEHSPAGVFLWSHHEKMVIIDQSVAFLGGIDLCFGRWDDDLHRLVDLGKKENKIDIEKTSSTTNAILSLASQIKKFSLEAELINDMSKVQPSAVLAAASLPTVPEPAAASPAAASIEVVSPDPNQIELQERQAATTPTAEAVAEEQQIEEVLQKKPDALIVAALMGNSIAKFNRNAKRTRQQTAPIKFNHSPVSETGTTAVTTTTTATGAPAATPTTPQAKVAAVLDRFKSLQLSHHNEPTGLGAVNQTYSDTKSSNVNDNRQTNSAEITTTTTTNTAAQNSSTTKKNTTLNTSKLAANANSRVLGSKASKLMTKLRRNSDNKPEAASKRNAKKEVDVVKKDLFKNLKKIDLSVPTDPSKADDDDEGTKERVRRKWSRFKKSVKKKSHAKNPLKRLRRRSNGSYEFDSDNSSENSSDEEDKDGAESYRYEENAEPPVISNEGYYWIGKDYSNTYKADFKDVADFSRDQFDRNETPRMPWRDEALVVIGESARDLARHFIQRWNQCKREKVRQIHSYPFLLPKSYTEPFDYDYSWFKDQLFKCEVQMTRSLDSWSGGLCQTETSILNSYCDLISKAEHFIYIENQFFVTTTDPNKDYEVKNPIGRELVNRIIRAHKEGKKFRVYVVLPLLPGFENFNAIQAVQFYNLRSINLGDFSIYKTLKKEGISDPSEYITFHGMRNWSVLMGKLVQEIIYVHSKLMIVDDKYVICGSANINDRSMLGKRDSEVAAVIKDQEFIEATLSGQKVMVGKYANSLRKKIFKLHLGIYYDNSNKIEVQDCVSEEFYNLFRITSHQNTVIYDEVFKCLPSDNILNFEHLTTYSERSALCKHDPYKGKQELEANIKGFIVDFPLKFLSQEKNFFPEINTPEGMVPTAMWT